MEEPSYISDTYLGLFLAQLRNDGYHIFVIRGSLDHCQGDDLIDFAPEGKIPFSQKRSAGAKEDESEETELEKAIAMSLGAGEEETEDALLQAAIAASLEGPFEQEPSTSQVRSAAEAGLSAEDMRRKRLEKFSNI